MDKNNTTDINDQEVRINKSKKPLKIIWNVKTFQCVPFGYNFLDLLDKYNIIHNENDDFRGNVISILYDPGKFPAILKREDDVDELRNGGVPQEGNLTEHLECFAKDVEKFIPDPQNSGFAIIDHELWRPIYRQNWTRYLPYQILSENLERQEHPDWSDEEIVQEATKKFEEFAKLFMLETLNLAKSLRPNAQWGYYHYPFSHTNGKQDKCNWRVIEENDRLRWLYKHTDILYPSVYLQEAHTPEQRVCYIETSMDEAIRVRNNQDCNNKKIYVYYWYKYQDTRNFLTKEDLEMTLRVFTKYDIDGIIVWGAHVDVNKKPNCSEVYNYIENVLGPTLQEVFSE